MVQLKKPKNYGSVSIHKLPKKQFLMLSVFFLNYDHFPFCASTVGMLEDQVVQASLWVALYWEA